MTAPFVFFDDGIYRVNQQLFTAGTLFATGWRFGLFVNNITPTYATLITDFNEPTMAGYARWDGGLPGLGGPAAGVAPAYWPSHTFNFAANTAVQTVYGWFVEINFSGTIYGLGAARLAVPYLIPPAGGSLAIAYTWKSQKLP